MPKNRNKLTFKEWHATNPLRAWRLTNGVTQGTVALTLGVSQTSVRLWEFGQMRPTKDHVAGIGKAPRAPVCHAKIGERASSCLVRLPDDPGR